jgi:hypothetical protein
MVTVEIVRAESFRRSKIEKWLRRRPEALSETRPSGRQYTYLRLVQTWIDVKSNFGIYMGRIKGSVHLMENLDLI